MVLIQDFGISLKLDTEHQLLPLLGRLDALWRELGFGRDKADRCGKYELRKGIQDHARLVDAIDAGRVEARPAV